MHPADARPAHWTTQDNTHHDLDLAGEEMLWLHPPLQNAEAEAEAEPLDSEPSDAPRPSDPAGEREAMEVEEQHELAGLRAQVRDLRAENRAQQSRIVDLTQEMAKLHRDTEAEKRVLLQAAELLTEKNDRLTVELKNVELRAREQALRAQLAALERERRSNLPQPGAEPPSRTGTGAPRTPALAEPSSVRGAMVPANDLR